MHNSLPAKKSFVYFQIYKFELLLMLLQINICITHSIDQVTAIWIDYNNPNIVLERDITIHEHSCNKHRVIHQYGYYDPLQYPLLFSKGEGGRHQRIRKCRNSKSSITQMKLQPSTRMVACHNSHNSILLDICCLNVHYFHLFKLQQLNLLRMLYTRSKEALAAVQICTFRNVE